jgi:pre-mRNA-splicing factor SYF2
MRQKKAEWLIKDKQTKEEVEAEGLDYDRVKLLNVSALEQEVS